LEHLLKKQKVIGKTDHPDTEICCFYIYFKTKQNGEKFIKKLNEYLKQKAELIEKARSF